LRIFQIGLLRIRNCNYDSLGRSHVGQPERAGAINGHWLALAYLLESLGSPPTVAIGKALAIVLKIDVKKKQ